MHYIRYTYWTDAHRERTSYETFDAMKILKTSFNIHQTENEKLNRNRLCSCISPSGAQCTVHLCQMNNRQRDFPSTPPPLWINNFEINPHSQLKLLNCRSNNDASIFEVLIIGQIRKYGTYTLLNVVVDTKSKRKVLLKTIKTMCNYLILIWNDWDFQTFGNNCIN